jgi:hypothetical protein
VHTGEPRRQGYFDYLCGLYAIVNACNKVGGLKDGDDEAVFHHLVEYINSENKLYTALTHGMEFDEMRLLMEKVSNEYRINFDTPFLSSNKTDLSKFIQECSKALSGNQSVIIFLKRIPLNYPEPSIKDITHWTVIDDISSQKLYLFDSYGFNFINLKDLEHKKGNLINCYIDFSYTIFIKKR